MNAPLPPDRLSEGRSSPAAARILVDLAHAADGYVGIAQDTRVNFDMLSGLPGIEASGLLLPTGRHDLPHLKPSHARNAALQAAVLHWMSRNWDAGRMGTMLGRLREVARSLRSGHDLIEYRGNKNVVWRLLFDKTLAADRREAVTGGAFYATDMSVMRMIDRVLRLRVLPPHRLRTAGFDFALFSMPRPVRMTPGTRQLVRFHDAVPITDIDTQTDWLTAYVHQQLTRRCDADAVFICNSPQSLKDLVALDPKRARDAVVIPCALAPRPAQTGEIPFEMIATARRTFRVLETTPQQKPKIPTAPRYLLTVGTLEPRKNQVALIRAWERVISRTTVDLRLVLVGNPGWHQGPIEAAMRPHVRSGRMLHLERLTHDELLALARGAEAFVFPSFNEGFGYPPLEARQAGASCIVSDIPVFRWTFGEGALFVDPYDIESIAGGIERLVLHEAGTSLRAELASHRARILERFSMATIRNDWADLIDRLRGRSTAPRPLTVSSALESEIEPARGAA